MISILTFSPSLSVLLTCSHSLFLAPKRPKCRYLYISFLVKKYIFFLLAGKRDVLKEREILFFIDFTVKYEM